jgi:guanine deaminase
MEESPMTTSGRAVAERTWLDRAVQAAADNVRAGGGPFGALVVRAGELISVGVNQVTSTLDPTAHAEVVAIRAACQNLDGQPRPDRVLTE